MAETNDPAAPAPDVQATIVESSTATNIDTTTEEVKNAQANANAVGPDTFGVSQAQFDKYYNDGQYNWEAHAKELQFQAEQRGQNNEAKPQEENQTAPEDAQQAVEQAGLNWEELNWKIGAKGDIDISDYQALMQMGIPEEVIRGHVQMVAQQVQTHVTEVEEAFGGKEAWQQTQAWADRNLSEGEIDHLNRMLAGPDYQMAVDMLKQRAGTAMQTGPQTVPGVTQVAPYNSQAEMVADQMKPEYRRDPAFRQQVMQRAAISSFANTRHTL